MCCDEPRTASTSKTLTVLVWAMAVLGGSALSGCGLHLGLGVPTRIYPNPPVEDDLLLHAVKRPPLARPRCAGSLGGHVVVGVDSEATQPAGLVMRGVDVGHLIQLDRSYEKAFVAGLLHALRACPTPPRVKLNASLPGVAAAGDTPVRMVLERLEHNVYLGRQSPYEVLRVLLRMELYGKEGRLLRTVRGTGVVRTLPSRLKVQLMVRYATERALARVVSLARQPRPGKRAKGKLR